VLSDKTEKGINEGVFGGTFYFQVGGRIAPVTQQVGEGDEDNDECVSDTAALNARFVAS
jgi:hypothetical protein